MNSLSRWVIGGLLGALTISTPAFGLTCAGGTLFTLNAGDLSGGFSNDAASACVTFSTGSVSVTLTNDTGAGLITNVPNLLDGFSFTITPGGGAVSGLSSVTPTNAVDCTDTANCATVGTANFDVDNGSGFTGSASNFYWGSSTTNPTFYGSGCTNSAALSTTTPGVFAGLKGSCFALEPGAIVNTSVLGPAPNGLQTAPHNDLLMGPVTFVLACSTCATTSTAVTGSGVFYWGTDGTHNGGSVPEPTSVLLLGTALLFAGKLIKMKLAA